MAAADSVAARGDKLLAPLSQLTQDRQERRTGVGEQVFVARRVLAVTDTRASSITSAGAANLAPDQTSTGSAVLQMGRWIGSTIGVSHAMHLPIAGRAPTMFNVPSSRPTPISLQVS